MADVLAFLGKRWQLIFVLVLATQFLWTCAWMLREAKTKLDFDEAYECHDTSGQHAAGLTWYYHLRLHPSEVSEKRSCRTSITPTKVQWDCGVTFGIHLTGQIDRITGQWAELADGRVDKSGVCKKLK
jgi:hypothetical protein